MITKKLRNTCFAILLTLHPVSWGKCAPFDPPECRDASTDNSDNEFDRMLTKIVVIGIFSLGALGLHYINTSIDRSARRNEIIGSPKKNNNYSINFYANQETNSGDFGVNLQYRF